MNNDTTQHDTTHNTTRHYYMGTYSLGHHLWVAGESYMDTAQALIGAGNTDFARTFIGQAEEAYCWANALQAGSVKESLEDLLGVEIDTLDAWVAPERMSDLKVALAMAEHRALGGTLPVSPSDVSPSGHSPENVSRETSSCTVQVNAAPTPPPVETSPSAYDGDMETHTNTATAISDLVTQLITLIASQVLSQVTSEVESICETIAENVYDSKDIAEEVTESYDFTSAVESIISDYDLSDKVRDALGDVTFTVSVD
jgi:hypothetical protein